MIQLHERTNWSSLCMPDKDKLKSWQTAEEQDDDAKEEEALPSPVDTTSLLARQLLSRKRGLKSRYSHETLQPPFTYCSIVPSK